MNIICKSKQADNKKGSALILVVLVFSLLMVMVAIGLVMVNFSVQASTRQANLKQAQLTARSSAETLANYLTQYPEEIDQLVGRTTSTESIPGMGDYAITVSPYQDGGSRLVITAVAQYPSAGSSLDKYTVTSTSAVTLAKILTHGGNPFSSTLYVNDSLTLPNASSFLGSVTMVGELIEADVLGGNAKLYGTLIVGGDYDIAKTSVDIYGDLFVAGDAYFKPNSNVNDAKPPDNIWVWKSIKVQPDSTAFFKNAFVIDNVEHSSTPSPMEYAIDNIGKKTFMPEVWLVGGSINGCPNSIIDLVVEGTERDILIGPEDAVGDPRWDVEKEKLEQELAKVAPLSPSLAAPKAYIQDTYLGYPLVSDVDGTFTIDASTEQPVSSASLVVQSEDQNIVINTNDHDVYIKIDFNVSSYTGTISNTGNGRVFLYASPSASGLIMYEGTIGSLITDDSSVPYPRLFFISSSENPFTLGKKQGGKPGYINAFMYLPEGKFVGHYGVVNGSVAASVIELLNDAPKLIFAVDSNYMILDPDWLDGTPFEVNEEYMIDTDWAVAQWSNG